MRKSFFCCAFFAGFLATAKAQLTVSLQEPPSAIVQKSQLWNITLVNADNTPLDITIELTLMDANENQPVLTAITRPIPVTGGITQLRDADVEPVQYSYLSPSLDGSRSPNAFLPVGSYRACYTFYAQRHGQVVLAEECMNFVVAPLSPPQLNIPTDSETVETAYPQFNWLPPTPMVLFSDLNYDLLVTEVQAGQSPVEAIQENLPIYTADHLRTMVQNYPASYKNLDTGRVYAWRIVAKNGEAFAGQSEVWTFRIASRKPEPLVVASRTYVELKNDNSYTGTATIPDDTLAIKFYSYDRTHDGAIRFLDETGVPVETINRKVQYGNNFFVLTLDRSFNPDKTYFIELAGLQNDRYKASFRIAK